MPIRVLITRDYDEMSRRAAEVVSAVIRPGAVLGLATGNTFLGCYRELVRMHREMGLDFSRVKTFNLDEYVGLSPAHPQSFRHFMDENFFNHVNIGAGNIHFLDGMADDLQHACQKFEEAIRAAGGIDLQLLGIGTNGHIAFNEPGSPFDSRTRVVELSEGTRRYNARFFGSFDEVPTHALSMGIGTIMEAKKIVLLASGEGKAAAVAGAVEGPVTEQVPASVLQRHPDCTFIIDEAAASRLSRVHMGYPELG
jgi:glucosamine-6-phosphate deaminase